MKIKEGMDLADIIQAMVDELRKQKREQKQQKKETARLRGEVRRLRKRTKDYFIQTPQSLDDVSRHLGRRLK